MSPYDEAVESARGPQDEWQKEAPPTWECGPEPGLLKRWCMRLAGADYTLARTMPTNEQQQIARVGGALIAGTVFQFTLFAAALAVAFGFGYGTIPLAAIITAVLYHLDSQFVASHWMSQGLELCRANGILSTDSANLFKRPIAKLARWPISGFIGWTAAIFVLILALAGDIRPRLEADHRERNAPLVAVATERFKALVGDIDVRIERSDVNLGALNRERAALVAAVEEKSEIDPQIQDLIVKLRMLETEKAEADRLARDHQRDAQAEENGVKTRPGHTGNRGHGDQYKFHTAMAAKYLAIARQRTGEIQEHSKLLAELRRQNKIASQEQGAQKKTRLENVERQIGEETANREKLAVERKQLLSDEKRWIKAWVDQSPDYVWMPSGLGAKLKALGMIIAESGFIAGLVFALKALLMSLELAGPLTAMAFSQPTIYAMRIALRTVEAAQAEADRLRKLAQSRAYRRREAEDPVDGVDTTLNAREKRSDRNEDEKKTILTGMSAT